jgi:hypothetical protein
VDFFRNAGRVLKPTGLLMLKTYVPTQDFLYPAKSIQVRKNTSNTIELSVTSVDRINQKVLFSELVLEHGAPVRVLPVEQRFAWPSELDLMAAMAGLSLIERNADYVGTPMDGKAVQCVSLYKK